MHYVAMMAIAAVISIAGMRSADDFSRAFNAVTVGDMTGAAGYAVLGVRRALRDADNHQLPQHLRQMAVVATSAR